MEAHTGIWKEKLFIIIFEWLYRLPNRDRFTEKGIRHCSGVGL